MITASEYDTTTGLFSGTIVTASDAHLLASPRPGIGYIEGEYRRNTSCVDLATGLVVPYRPPAPEATELATWAWDDTEAAWQPVPTLAALRLDAWQRIKAARAADACTPVTVGDYSYQADPASREALLRKALAAQVAWGAGHGADWLTEWTTADNRVATLSASQLLGVVLTLDRRDQQHHEHSQRLRARIDAAQSADALDNITWSPGS